MPEIEPLKLVTGSPNVLRQRESGDTIPVDAVPVGTPSVAGSMSAADKTKLNALVTAAQNPAGGTTAQALVKQSGTDYDYDWADQTGGAGDVTGPASSADNQVARYDGTTGKALQTTGVVIGDLDDISGVRNIALTGTVDGRDVAADGTTLDAIESGATADQTAKNSVEIDADEIQLVNDVASPGNNYVYGTTSGGVKGWKTDPTGSIGGTLGATDNRVPRADGTGGTTLQTTGVAISDLEDLSGVRNLALTGTVDGRDVATDGTKLDSIASSANNYAHPNHSGDVTSVADGAQTIVNDAVTNAKAGNMAVGTVKLRAATQTATGDPEDGTAAQLRHIVNVREGAGGAAFMVPRFNLQARIPELHRVGQWIAGDVADTNLATSHGTAHLYPFMCFSAVNFYGFPHLDHDRLASGASGVNTSGFNGYEEGLFLLAGTLGEGDAVKFSAEGFMENTVHLDAFVEFVLEPNPATPTTGGANRMRMLSGELGATWTGTKAFRWECVFAMGEGLAGDEYGYEWSMHIEDVLDTGGRAHVTGGHAFKTVDTYLGARFRVDEITNLNTYSTTYQALTTLRLEVQKYDAGAA